MNEVRKRRRDRSAKPALSMDWIVTETIAIMHVEGLERATMRRVAEALDTGVASLYVYVDSNVALHAAVLDRLLGGLLESLADSAEGVWRTRLRAILQGYADLLFEHPGLARSALVQRPSGPNAIRLYDRILALLIEGDVEAHRAAWGVDLLLLHVTGSAAEHSPSGKHDVDAATSPAASVETLSKTLRQADAAQTPHAARYADELVSGTPSDRFNWALDAVVNGIASTPIPAT